MTEIKISLHDLKFIRDGYKNLAENGTDNMRAVGKGVDCKVECKTYKELYEHYVKSLDIAIKALEKQMPKKIYHFIDDNTFETSCCGIDVTNEDFEYCPECGQLLGGVEEIENEVN